MDFPASGHLSGYRVLRKLGQGGMGAVYEVVRESTGEHLALKAFTLDHGNRDFLRKRFLAEAKILAKLENPRLVKVRELAVADEGKTPYFVMDLVLNSAGQPETLEDARKAGKVTERLALQWYEELRQGLAYIHQQGVVHRDVKLENVLVDAHGRAVLSDFGVSRIFAADVRDELMVTTTVVTGETTGTKPVMGTYWYLAPEIRKGGEATPASDWYALGVLMYRLLTGLWYEPGTQAFDLLAPFSKECQKIVRRLLSADPSARTPVEGGTHGGTGSAVVRRLARVLIVGVLLGIVGVMAFRKTAEKASEPSMSAPMVLTYGKDSVFRFLPCPAGTNGLDKTMISVTAPYYLQEVPVSRRIWYAVRGEALTAWRGGEEAPMTYVSRAEVTNFCARLNAAWADRLPAGYEIRLPTVAEWRLAYALGGTVTNFSTKMSEAQRKMNDAIGWFGIGANGEVKFSNIKTYYEGLNLPVPMVTNIWPAFPPHRIDTQDAVWKRKASQFAPVPVGLKPANRLGLRDMLGNCFEMVYDLGSTNVPNWGCSEFGFRVDNPYVGQGFSLTNPVAHSGNFPLMLGTYISQTLPGDYVWAAPFDRLPLLGFRLCLGPKLN